MGWQEVSTHTKDKTPIQIETWVLSSIVGNKCTPLFRTEPRHLSADRCPRPTARWRCVQRSTQGEESDMQVLAQWSDDVSYPRRTADYVPVNCVQSSKMDVSDPSGGGTKNVHFGEKVGSDSVSPARPPTRAR